MTDFRLLEDGDFRLLEDDDFRLLEHSRDPAAFPAGIGATAVAAYPVAAPELDFSGFPPFAQGESTLSVEMTVERTPVRVVLAGASGMCIEAIVLIGHGAGRKSNVVKTGPGKTKNQVV